MGSVARLDGCMAQRLQLTRNIEKKSDRPVSENDRLDEPLFPTPKAGSASLARASGLFIWPRRLMG